MQYLPAATAYCGRAAESGKQAAAICDWQRQLAQHWSNLRFGEVHIETQPEGYLFHVPVYLDELPPDAVYVELYADRPDTPFRVKMERAQPLAGSIGGWLYSAMVPADRPAADYTSRIVPQFPGVSVPLEAGQILWQK
jgi:starch phosphorylase